MLLSDREIAEGQRLAVSNMTDTCRIERVRSGRGAFDEGTGQYANDTGVRDVIYEGPCKVDIPVDVNANIVEPVELEREWGYQTSMLRVPINAPDDATGSTTDVRTDDIATILTAPYDPGLVGREFNIHTGYHKSVASSRRFRLREAVR